MEIYYNHYSDVKPEDWTWENFTPKEIASRTVVGGTQRGPKGPLLLNTEALDALQALRTHLGKPMIINSAYRSPEYNSFVGGASKSFHMKGVAFDVSLKNLDRDELKEAAALFGFTGIGDYNSFVHIDTRGYNAYWDNRT